MMYLVHEIILSNFLLEVEGKLRGIDELLCLMRRERWKGKSRFVEVGISLENVL